MSDWMDELGQKVKDAKEQAKEATSNQEAENARLQPLVVDFSHRFLERWKALTTRFNSCRGASQEGTALGRRIRGCGACRFASGTWMPF